MSSEIILNKKQGLILSVSNNKSRSFLKLCDGAIELRVESFAEKKKSQLKISNEEIIFDAEYININADEFINNITNEFQIKCKDSLINISNDFYTNSDLVKFKIHDLANINSKKIVFS